MIRTEYILNGVLGPNRITVAHNPDTQRIECECDKNLLVEDMRQIEEYLNLNMYLGSRHNYSYYTLGDGRIVIGWTYIETMDNDWS